MVEYKNKPAHYLKIKYLILICKIILFFVFKNLYYIIILIYELGY